MKPWTEKRNNNKYMKYHSKPTYQLSFWSVSRKVDYHAGGKWIGIFTMHYIKNVWNNHVSGRVLNTVWNQFVFIRAISLSFMLLMVFMVLMSIFRL